MRAFILIAAISGFIGVAAGAFGAHGLRGRLTPELLAVFETGVRYQLFHTLALLAAAWVCALVQNPVAAPSSAAVFAAVAGWCFLAGIVIFSGSLYLLALTGVRWLGAITPIGGLAFLAGWATLALAAVKMKA